jgi:hypothetical protein
MVTRFKSREVLRVGSGTSFAEARRMKLSLISVAAFLLLLVLPTKKAWASPNEDALASGDIDVEDVAIQSPFTTRSGARFGVASVGRAIVPAPTNSAWLSLVGFSHRTIDDRSEVGGFLVLGLPLDRFARGGTRGTSQSPPLGLQLASDQQQQTQLPMQIPPQQPFDLALTPRLARSCVSAAWRAAGLGSDDARLDAIVSRARWSAILPEARLRAVRFEDARLSLDTGTDTSRLRDSAGANVGFEARLTWRFDRVLYADDEPSFERIRLEQHDARSRIAARVLEALFHWQRAALDLRTLPPSQQGTRDEADVTLRVMEAEAALDVLTNGWFSVYGSKSSKSGRGERGRQPPYAAPIPITKPGDL